MFKSLIIRRKIQLNCYSIHCNALLWPVHVRLPHSTEKADFVVFHTKSKKPNWWFREQLNTPCSCLGQYACLGLGQMLLLKSSVWLTAEKELCWIWKMRVCPCWKAHSWKWESPSWLKLWALYLAQKGPPFCSPCTSETWLKWNHLLFDRDPSL